MMVDGTLLMKSAFCLIPVTVSAEAVQILAEGENECTSERLLGQFSIFGAVEENIGKKFSRSKGIKELGEDSWLGRVESGNSTECERWGKTFLGRGRADCPQGVHRKCRKGVGRFQFSFSVLGSRLLVSGFRFCIGGCGVLGEPTEQALFELVRIGADGAAVICARDLPENCLGIAGVDETRVTQRNIAIDVSVDGQNWDSRGGDGIF